MKGVFYMLEELPVSDHGRELTQSVVELFAMSRNNDG